MLLWLLVLEYEMKGLFAKRQPEHPLAKERDESRIMQDYLQATAKKED